MLNSTSTYLQDTTDPTQTENYHINDKDGNTTKDKYNRIYYFSVVLLLHVLFGVVCALFLYCRRSKPRHSSYHLAIIQ